MKRFMLNSYKILSLLFFLIIWEIVAYFVDNSLLFPGIVEVFKALLAIIIDKSFFAIVLKTLFRLLQTLFFSTVGAILLGAIAYNYPIIELLFKPFSVFLRAVPTIAIIILVLIWSSPETVPIVVGVLILFPILYESILGALKKTDKHLLQMSQVFKVSKYRVVTEIYIPSVYYSISTNFPSYLGLTFKVIIAGEVLAQENLSIGGEIFTNKIYLESANIFSWIIIVLVLNFILEKGLKFINQKNCRWQGYEN